jgi:hypothetical protein
MSPPCSKTNVLKVYICIALKQAWGATVEAVSLLDALAAWATLSQLAQFVGHALTVLHLAARTAVNRRGRRNLAVELSG